MWDLPRPELEPVSPVLAGGFLNHCTTREVRKMLVFLRLPIWGLWCSAVGLPPMSPPPPWPGLQVMPPLSATLGSTDLLSKGQPFACLNRKEGQENLHLSTWCDPSLYFPCSTKPMSFWSLLTPQGSLQKLYSLETQSKPSFLTENQKTWLAHPLVVA